MLQRRRAPERALWADRQESRWICALERGAAALPTPQEMRADIEAKKQWIAKYYQASLRHTIEEEHLYYLYYLDELDKSERTGRRRMARAA